MATEPVVNKALANGVNAVRVGDEACDHHHRSRGQLAQQLGVTSRAGAGAGKASRRDVDPTRGLSDAHRTRRSFVRSISGILDSPGNRSGVNGGSSDQLLTKSCLDFWAGRRVSVEERAPSGTADAPGVL